MYKKSKLRSAWQLYATLSGFLNIALLLSWLLLRAVSVDGPVVLASDGPKNVTKTVPYLGTLSYTFDMVRRVSCPGTIVYNLVSQTNHGPPAVVTFRRPLQSTEIKSYDDIVAKVILPESVFPGKWSFQSSMDSVCPTYERTDLLVNFTFDVVMPGG